MCQSTECFCGMKSGGERGKGIEIAKSKQNRTEVHNHLFNIGSCFTIMSGSSPNGSLKKPP